MEPDDLLCSRNARPQKALVGRAQWKINQSPSLKREKACLEGACKSLDARSKGQPRLLPLSEVQGVGRFLLRPCPRNGASNGEGAVLADSGWEGEIAAGVGGMIPTARVQRGLSQAARCASTGIVPATPPPFSAS